METYTKLFQNIIASSVWQEPMETKLVWITMLAMADQHGKVSASVPGLAHIAGVPLKATETAIETFLAPDPYSRTTDNEGRRIEPTDGGWVILNHSKYRNMRHGDDRREYQRQWVAQKRASEQSVDRLSTMSTNVDQQSTQANTDTNTEVQVHNTHVHPVDNAGAKAPAVCPVSESRKVGVKQRPTEQEVELYAAKIGLPQSEAAKFMDYYDSNGWRVGRNPMRDWRKAMSGWRTRWAERNHQDASKRNYKTISEEQNMFLDRILNEEDRL